ncbi:hypothetical protein VSH64_42190 [Amycolatopsis rhabdoformis]|uniref:Uncharacterized protein n=1 Tax=Amycolatopsis rhabdoformis TaxID=1448059 RepID=A0ABZ1I747_9PSEU|nr:hypothetical protein [Amycolatopsis rhabdoformis]WSE29348.1 hypothetical protein VSH64_42190 [Amycolatopsis rhabdoformis]
MRKRAVFAAIGAIGAIAAVTVTGQAVAAPGGQSAGAPKVTASKVNASDVNASNVTVQLNQDTAALHGLVNHFQRGEDNVALADCPGAKSGTATFSSPVLKFSGYDFGPFIGVQATVSADAALAPGTAAGSYPLTITCAGKAYNATFTVPAAQVAEVPAGGAKAGDGSLAE